VQYANTSSTQKTSNQKDDTRYNNNKEKRHTPILKGKEIQPKQVKAIIILISTSTNKHMHNTNSRSKKNRECLVQLYEAIIPI
jgi:hypothetical protein